MLPTKFWAEMCWRDFAAADMSKVVAVLPVAAIEQHGPHLPVGVDTFINEGYFARAVKRIPDEMPVLILPTQAIGKSNEHIEYPGTLTFSLETVTRAWTEIGDSVARTGCRKLIFMNSHGGNVPVIDAVARELRVRHRMLAVHAAGIGWAIRRSCFPLRSARTASMAARLRRRSCSPSGRIPCAWRSAEFRQRGDRDRAGISPASGHPADRLRLDGERFAPARHGWRCFQGDGREGRSLRRERGGGVSRFVARRVGFRSCAPQAGAACRRGMDLRALKTSTTTIGRSRNRPQRDNNWNDCKHTRRMLSDN